MTATTGQVKREGARSVRSVGTAHRQLEGGGFPVRRPFPTYGLEDMDPFLLLDEMGPVDWRPGEAIGAPDHPHRGFETVTYVLEGQVEHKDSRGNEGLLNPGDVQWMTAGAGVVHSEMPPQELKRRGGTMHGFQLWVNLPRRDKMMAPRYQDVPSSRIPEAHSEDGRAKVRVIAGEALGSSAVIDTRIPITLQHWTVQPGGRVAQPVAREQTAFVYVFRGAGVVGGEGQGEARPVGEGQMARFSADGDHVAFGVDEGAQGPMELLLVAGEPLREPVVRHGPFVMNTKKEILEAFRDFETGRMGRIGG